MRIGRVPPAGHPDADDEFVAVGRGVSVAGDDVGEGLARSGGSIGTAR
jgi:hypothetical protein